MISLVVVSVVLGLAYASPVLPRNSAVVDAETQAFLQHKAAADAAFIQEYTRLALLAAEAPDIHIFTDDSQHAEAQSVQYQAEEVVQDPVEHVREDVIQVQIERVAGHQAGHLAGHQAQVVPTQTLTAQEIIVPRWEGPLADTVPAGVNGIPRQVTETPEVMAARQALFEAHAAVPQADPEYNPIPADTTHKVQAVQKCTACDAKNKQTAHAAQVPTSVNSIPHDFIFQAKHEPAIVSHNQVGLLAGHLAGQHNSVHSVETPTARKPTIKKWEGPFADTVPAGVNGAPTQVTETPAVQHARQALYAAHAAVPTPDPLYN